MAADRTRVTHIPRNPGKFSRPSAADARIRVVDAVVFDLDDTLIVEEDAARAALAEALRSVGAPCEVGRALDAIRHVWRSSPHDGQCLKLGIASWEGLWASF